MEIILLIIAVVIIGGILSSLGGIFSSLSSFAGIGFKVIVWLVLIAIMIGICRHIILPMLLP